MEEEDFSKISYYIHEVKEEYEGVPLQTKETWVLLMRLLHRMKNQEDIPENAQGQTWHSLILRAQMAQDMWKSISHEVASRDFEVYQSISNRVDHLCRRAHRLAEERRAQSPPDLIDEIFFSNGTNESDSSDSDDDSEEEMGEKSEDAKRTNASVESGGDGSNDRRVRWNTPEQNDTKSTTPMTNEELQKAQREQMEEAIAQMARHMKEATMGISSTLQKQTQSTLNELETVAEQNVQDMSRVTANVTEHNQKQWRKNFSTWSMMFLLVGIFVFTMLMIFTLPKHPNASLLGKGGMVRSSVSWLSRASMRVARWTQKQTGILHDSEGDYNDAPPPRKREWEHLFEENEAERREKEKLDNFLASRHDRVRKYGNDDDDDSELKVGANDRNDEMEDSFADRNTVEPKPKSSKKKSKKNFEGGGYMESEINAGGDRKQGGDPADVNMDELIASLNRQAQKALEEQKMAQHKELEAKMREEEEEARKAREEEEARVRAEEAAKEEAERLAEKERARKARLESVRLAREEAARRAKAEEEARIRAEEEEAAQAEAERQVQEERERKEREEELRKAREEEEARLRAEVAAEAERRAKEERERKENEEELLQKARDEEAARVEAERRALEERERKEREEALRRAKEEEEAQRQREAEEARRRAEEAADAQAERFAQIERERIAREEALRSAREEEARKAREEELRKRTEEASNLLSDRFAQLEREQRKQEEELEKARKAQEEAEARVRAEEAAAAEAERLEQERLRIQREEAAQAVRVEAERRARIEEQERLEREAAWRQAREEAAREQELARKNPHDSEEHLQERLQHIEEHAENRAHEEKRARMEDERRHDEEFNMEEYVERGRKKLNEYLAREGNHDEL